MCSLAPSLWLATFGWTCTNVCSLNWEVTTDVPMHFFDLEWNSNTEAEARGRLADSEMARGRLGFGQFLVLLRFLLVTWQNPWKICWESEYLWRADQEKIIRSAGGGRDYFLDYNCTLCKKGLNIMAHLQWSSLSTPPHRQKWAPDFFSTLPWFEFASMERWARRWVRVKEYLTKCVWKFWQIWVFWGLLWIRLWVNLRGAVGWPLVDNLLWILKGGRVSRSEYKVYRHKV